MSSVQPVSFLLSSTSAREARTKRQKKKTSSEILTSSLLILSKDQRHIRLQSHESRLDRLALVQEPDSEERTFSSFRLSPLDLLLELVQGNGVGLGFPFDVDDLVEQGSERLFFSDVDQEEEGSRASSSFDGFRRRADEQGRVGSVSVKKEDERGQEELERRRSRGEGGSGSQSVERVEVRSREDDGLNGFNHSSRRRSRVIRRESQRGQGGESSRPSSESRSQVRHGLGGGKMEGEEGRKGRRAETDFQTRR